MSDPVGNTTDWWARVVEIAARPVPVVDENQGLLWDVFELDTDERSD
jgi:hypothetical protein